MKFEEIRELFISGYRITRIGWPLISGLIYWVSLTSEGELVSNYPNSIEYIHRIDYGNFMFHKEFSDDWELAE